MWWHALGCEPTDDKDTVKRAYAALIKTIDQDKDIEKFTNVHKAYRMAMKSFRTGRDPQARQGLIEFDKEGYWYLQELAKIYNNPKRRLDTSAWKYLFACMSFIEEKHFLSEYVDFFNEHYALTEDIWALVQKYYPLANKKEFRWPEIVNGHLNLTESEIGEMPFDEASSYVTYKIHVFYGLLDNDYDRSIMFLRLLLDRYDRPDLNLWYLVTAIGLGDEAEIKTAYDRMSGQNESKAMADYLYGGYLYRKGEVEKAAALIGSLETEEGFTALNLLKAELKLSVDEENTLDLGDMPWTALDALTPKQAKLLAKGAYNKLQHSDKGMKFKLFGGR